MPSSLTITPNFPGTRRQAVDASAPMKWWHLVLLLWTIAGLAVCSETIPDVAGHVHAHSASHLSDPWHGLPGERLPDDDEKKKTDFHYHQFADFSAIDSDIPSVPHVAVGSMATCPTRSEDERTPVAPDPDLERPPLIRFPMA